MPRSISRIDAIPSSSTRQLSTSALSVNRSTRSVAVVSAAVVIEAFSGLGAELAAGHELLEPAVDMEALAIAVPQVLGHVHDGVEPEQVGEKERPHRRRARLCDQPVEF